MPQASYRLQLHAGFGFAEASAAIPYISRLGASHLYLSPIFAAAPGSTHGYDVFDHGRVNPELGGVGGLYELGEQLVRHQMGLILDVVPNHVGIAGGANPWWRHVLQFGRRSRYANYFDIDWDAQPHMASGVLIFPVLGEPFGRTLEAGQLQLAVQDGEVVVRYFEHTFPLRPETYRGIVGLPPIDLSPRMSDPAALPAFAQSLEGLGSNDSEAVERSLARIRGLLQSEQALEEFVAGRCAAANGTVGDPTSFDRLEALLLEQHYRLSDWRLAGAELNYRRFFDNNTLAAIRVERDDVFEETHALVLDLVAQGIVTGLRIDHVDGLYDPGEYLRRLRTRLDESCPASAEAGVPIFVEKVLEHGERLPEGWPVAGTTGYEFLAKAEALWIDPSAERALTATYARFLGHTPRLSTLRYNAKLFVAETAFAGDISVLAYQLHRIGRRYRLYRDISLRSLRDAIEATLACFPVYRTYLEGTGSDAVADAVIRAALGEAGRRNAGIPADAFAFLREILLLEPGLLSEDEVAQRRHFRRRFQQFSGPIMAKGVEDTTYFRYSRLLSLNEVGNDPGVFGSDPDEIHRWFEERARTWPASMNATSTHDTKRGEDARARLDVLTECPADWDTAVTRWAQLNAVHKRRVDGDDAPSPNDEYYLYQTLVATLPDEGLDESYRRRVREHVLKAAREAKEQTGYLSTSVEYEDAITAFADRVTDEVLSPEFCGELAAFVNQLRPAAEVNALSTIIVKALAPGFPDFYQGAETEALTMTDPDNRHDVDFTEQLALLEYDGGEAPRAERPRRRVRLVQQLLRLRNQQPELFASGGYEALRPRGERAANLFAFARTHGSHAAVAVVPRLTRNFSDAEGNVPAAAWGNTTIELPAAVPGWRDELTGQTFASGSHPAAGLLAHFPFAVLVPA